MNGAGDAWSVSACGGSDDGGPQDNMILNRIMLRFRPIAPKPVAGGSAVATAAEVHGKAPLPGKRAKRKYVRVRRNNVRVRKNNNGEENKSPEKPAAGGDGVAVVTLQLMPEKEEEGQALLAGDSWCKNVDLDLTLENIQILDNLEPRRVTVDTAARIALDPAPAQAVVESWVTVESVTGTCMGESEGEGGGGGLLGCTDAEKLKNLESDTCPGFVSDGYWGVRWVNEAFKRMVASEQALPEVMLWLKVKDSAAWGCCYSYPSFTCGVRLQYTWRNEKCTKLVPCDVWRLDSGGFAWRLDVKAALGLGL